jgi:Uma2 family endonuclease
MAAGAHYDEMIELPRAVRFPVELYPPPGFDPERLETWPRVVGRLEFVDGRLFYMPPCSDLQQDTVTDVVITVGAWVRTHPDFVLGTNEAGMHLRGSTRAADAAVWRRIDVGAYSGGLRRSPPVLAIEVVGADRDEPEAQLRSKAQWYLEAGVSVVWIVVPQAREVIVLTANGESRRSAGERLPEHPELPGLEPEVAELFQQLAAWSQ